VELKWLEDFLVLADTRNFSRAAKRRHITQSAFSRRIRALENWVGVELIDRRSHPLRLTRGGEVFRDQAVDLLQIAENARAVTRGRAPLPVGHVQYAVCHALSVGFFPQWLTQAEQAFGEISSRLMVVNVDDGTRSLGDGGCDILICYYHDRNRIELDFDHCWTVLGREHIRPYAKAGFDGKPIFALPGQSSAPLPFLTHDPNSYLRRLTDFILENTPCYSKEHHQVETTGGLKAMVLEGHGVGFLPELAVTREVQASRLAPAGDERWSLEVEIRAYRRRGNVRAEVDRMWEYLKGCSAPDLQASDAPSNMADVLPIRRWSC
jgi:LysR family transcriptional regulator, hypochlorite-specific transcription factor HypT